MKATEILEKLNSLQNEENRAGMKRFGINTENALGISLYTIRKIAKDIGRDHHLAMELWDTRIHEARILACLIDEPELVTPGQMEAWVHDFDSWDLCDQCCSNLFDKTPYAYEKALEWSSREGEFVRRAGFVMMAALSVHDTAAPDSSFEIFFPIIEREATDERNYVRKAVNWALRQIGKRNAHLNGEAIKTAQNIRAIDSKAARWIAADALRELSGEKVQRRLAKKSR